MYFAATLLASLVVSATGLVTPHHAHGGIHRRHTALAKARAADPAPVPVAPIASAAHPTRNLQKRCKPRPKPSPISSSEAPAATAPPENVAPVPTVSSSSQDNSTPSSSQDKPAPSPSQDKPAPSPAPAPSSTPSEPKPTPTPQAPAPPPPSGGGASGGFFSGSHTGQGTFYGTGLGACGITNNDSQFIVAISEKLFDTIPGYNGQNPNENPVCGKPIKVSFGKESVEVVVTDRCVACAYNDLDFSPAAFNKLANPDLGRIFGINWVWA